MPANQIEILLNTTFYDLSGQPVSASGRHVITCTDIQKYKDALPDGNVANHNGLAIAIADIEAIFFKCDQPVSIQFNTAGQTIALVANSPLVWFLTDDASYTYPFANPISQDISAIDITNNSGNTANYELQFGLTT